MEAQAGAAVGGGVGKGGGGGEGGGRRGGEEADTIGDIFEHTNNDSATRSVSAKGRSGFPRNSDGSILMVGAYAGTPDSGDKEKSSSSRRRVDAAGHRHAELGAQQMVYSESSASSAPAKELVDPGRQKRSGDGMGGGSDAEYESMDFEKEGLEELLV